MSSRREFITLLGGAAVAWPLSARAQQPKVYRIGVLMGIAESDEESQDRIATFRQTLQELGWIEGRNVQFEVRFSAGDPEQARDYAAELLSLTPDVVLAHSSLALGALRQAARTVPIVFAQVPDPVGGGFVASLPRPGGNITGFTSFEYQMSTKWLELLKEIAPTIVRAAVLTHSAFPAGPAQLRVLQSVSSSLGVQLHPVDVQDAAEIERGLLEIVHQSNVGMIVTTSAFATVHRELIVALAARHRLPAVYPYRYYVMTGGLVSYGIDTVDLYRRAAGYVDRILKGAKPADLPVQQPTKFRVGDQPQNRESTGSQHSAFTSRARRRGDRMMRRREFITLLGGAAATWPLAARAQQGERVRRIGVLLNLAENDPEGQARLGAFLQGLQQLGWTIGRNVQIEYRWGAGDPDRTRRYAAELVALAPDVILAAGGSAVGSLLQATRTVPIVFTQTLDPVGGGFVDSLARPGGNATGFTDLRIQSQREMAGAAQRDRARRDASGSPSGSRRSRRDRTVGRHPDLWRRRSALS